MQLEQYLKIRWHSLVQRYQRDRHFKYRDRMLFLREDQIINTTKLQAADTLATDWPEFVITEKDLINNMNEPEEYVFLEVDDQSNENQSNKTQTLARQKCSSSKPLSPAEKPIAVRTDEVKVETEEDTKTMTPLIRLQVFKDVKAVAESSKDVTIKATKSKESNSRHNRPATLENTEPEVNDGRGRSPPIKAPPNVSQAGAQGDRSEDVIFGELIVAMLKRMDEEKKRTVKKEIMNVLLT